MLNPDKLEELTRFVRRYCATDTAGRTARGRFFFALGPTARKAREAREPVPWGAYDPTIGEVIARVEDCLAERSGHVFVRAYQEGATHFSGQVRIDGSVEDLQADADWAGTEDMTGVGAAVMAVVQTNRMLLSAVTERDQRIMAYHQHQLVATRTVTQLAVREGIAEAAERAAASAEAVKSFAPLLATVLERAMGGGGAADEAPPTTNGERVVRAVDRIGRSVAELGAVFTADPAVVAEAGTSAALDRLRELVRQVAPALGLAIVDDSTEPA